MSSRIDEFDQEITGCFERNFTSNTWEKPIHLFQKENSVVKICSPMVRYSKLPFRQLVRKYDCDLAFTPMIIADSFVRSEKARENEFTTNEGDRPLITQFAANNATTFADAAELIYGVSDGIDLNCGCPQSWAIAEGYGAKLLSDPELIKDIVLQTRNRIPDPEFSISIKIRIHGDIRKTVNLCQTVERAGVSWIAVHGRTKNQRNEPVSLESVKTIKDSLDIPVIANGDIKSLDDVEMVVSKTGVNGVMVARGLLQNPSMFAGYEKTPAKCLQDWLDICEELDVQYTLFHNHLTHMCEKVLTKSERRIFNVRSNKEDDIRFLIERFGINENLRNNENVM